MSSAQVPVYDVAIIGGGTVGCAIVHELTGRGLKSVLCEQNSQLVQEASAGNSGIVHTGFDATPSTIEHQCLEDARILNKAIYNKYSLPFEERGALLVAWNQEQLRWERWQFRESRLWTHGSHLSRWLTRPGGMVQRIHPRKGQFAVFDQSAASLLQSIILPVPSERTKGVLVFPSVYGNIVVGPTAEDQTARENPQVHQKVIDELIAFAHFVLPELAEYPVVATYAGLRPATQMKDYHFILDKNR
uniref:FAD dependent oxidoreductase domain-containing protein n=1 Tax=Branchiostoma floridae TaxID=7739 RepID=C3Z4N0_BRAFL|eukprot:XP_002596457.1 hypothetical protein BRAFLDRAFT_103227 [Branchiostoma floridae]